MLFVTFHGGKPSKDVPNPVTNVYAYADSGGDPVETAVLHGADLKDAELRGMVFAYGSLYVANGRKDANQVLRFTGSGTRYKLAGVFASGTTADSIFHPFALAFDGSTYAYVSSQDTDVVTRLAVSGQGAGASAAPIPSGLPAQGTFLAGTFVASSVGHLPNVKTTPVAQPQGLAVAQDTDRKVQHSVRDVLLSGGSLLVCDEAAGLVKVYDLNGNVTSCSNPVPSPAHLLAYGGQLYVSGGDEVLAASLSSRPLSFAQVSGVDGKGAAGMTFNAKGDHFFVANRKSNDVHRYDVSGGTFSNKTKIISGMPDNPEFLVYVS
jgi:hypothetical protein